jgi:DNA polymerase
VSKYKALLSSVCKDGRLRGTLQFCGAPRSGRWSGRIFQPQNLPRPTHKEYQIDVGIDALKHGYADLIFPDIAAIASSCIRGAIVAPKGKKLVIADLSSIEGRVLAWLAGEQYKIHDYAEYDGGAGYDMYIQTYARTFGIKPEDVKKDQRQLGKVLELALGYGGGVGAFVTFSNAYNISLETLAQDMYNKLPVFYKDASSQYYDRLKEQGKKPRGMTAEAFITCDSIKKMWRTANRYTEKFWADCENAARTLLTEEAAAVDVGRVKFIKSGRWMLVRLPSGRCICYAGAHIKNGSVVYRGIDQYTRKWSDISTYGGKLAENITQAVSRDILVHGMIGAEDAGYAVVLSVHDELITETPDAKMYKAEKLSEIMATPPPWADGLPLDAKGLESYRYRKG